MGKMHFWLVVAMTLAIAGSGALAATSVWLSTDGVNGARISGDTLTAAPGATVTLYCFIDSNDTGNTYEVMVGYDRSAAATYGAGVGTFQDGKLALLSGKSDIEATIPAYFDVLKSAVLVASAREDSNTNIGGRPYGFVARGATRTNGALGKKMIFSFQLRNQMTTAQEHQYVVISNLQGGNSYSTAWKHGTALRECTYALEVVNGSALPTVGATNKAVLDAIMTEAVPNYIWVLWGKVGNLNASAGTFDIDDGSGVTIHVSASASDIASKGVGNSSYVAVRGTLNVSTKTITSQGITKY